MIQRLQRTLTAVALAVVLLPMIAAAGPADTTDVPAAEERAALLRMLNARSVATQEQAVRRIGTYAHTGRYGTVFFRDFVTPLLGLVAEGETEAVRLMAVSALATIATPHAMQGLQAQVNRLYSTRVQRVTRAALTQYEADRATRTPTGEMP